MDVQTVSIVVAAVGVLIAAVNQVYTSRQATEQRQRELETRQAQLFMQVYNRWTERDFSETYVKYRWRYNFQDYIYDEGLARVKDPSTFPLDKFVAQTMLANYFEGIGILVKERLIDINLVENLFQSRIVAIWEKTFSKGIINEARRVSNDPRYYENFEYLYNRLKQRQ